MAFSAALFSTPPSALGKRTDSEDPPQRCFFSLVSIMSITMVPSGNSWLVALLFSQEASHSGFFHPRW